ncbi:helix-turn-helix domain-containing protein [Alkalimarinus alittae]|uniref:Helix-turn-helix domain-containing protein n=1 Tax=Alkalimarinus alittae TaxID=2961619 RepID=A0ABY6N3P6_9ALTE|nr:helix-turn-helix transcriptional regulator [Alkalimarinus alittae]UZE96740.1 helix-turn-helix domain-containing protein [Alkalimarinus alittae]
MSLNVPKGESRLAETGSIVSALKRALKSHGLTYRDVGEALGIAESSVKRLFADKDFSLKRLDQICQLMHMEISELLQKMDQEKRLISQLTLEQEAWLVSDHKTLLVAICVANRWTFEDILNAYKLTEHELIKMLAALDKLKLIELQPNNRVKLLMSTDFSWIPNGPISRFFDEEVQSNFFKSRFNGPGEARIFASGMLSRASNEILIRKMERLAQEFRQFNEEDQELPLTERFGSSIMIAMRPWELAAFEAFRKDDNKRF